MFQCTAIFVLPEKKEDSYEDNSQTVSGIYSLAFLWLILALVRAEEESAIEQLHRDHSEYELK